MSTIPVSLTEKQFDKHIRPYISTAKRGFESKIPLFKIFNYVLYRLHTGCQWYRLPIAAEASNPDKKEISHDAVYYHFRKWSRDGSLQKVWEYSIMIISPTLNLSEINLDGSLVIAKKSGQAVAYQGRKKAKTTNILPMTRNRKTAKRGRKRFFNQEVYKRRFTSERSFAWIDKFRALLLRFDRCEAYFLGAHFIAFAMINLRHLLHD